jgi:hypothetical protein
MLLLMIEDRRMRMRPKSLVTVSLPSAMYFQTLRTETLNSLAAVLTSTQWGGSCTWFAVPMLFSKTALLRASGRYVAHESRIPQHKNAPKPLNGREQIELRRASSAEFIRK